MTRFLIEKVKDNLVKLECSNLDINDIFISPKIILWRHYYAYDRDL